MSTFMTNGWMDGVKQNIPKCPACGGNVDYGFMISREPIQWASDLKGNKFTDLERPITGPFKKPLGISMARCHVCRLMITIYPPERE